MLKDKVKRGVLWPNRKLKLGFLFVTSAAIFALIVFVAALFIQRWIDAVNHPDVSFKVDLPETIPMPAISICRASFFNRTWEFSLTCSLCDGICPPNPYWRRDGQLTPFSATPNFVRQLPITNFDLADPIFPGCQDGVGLGLDSNSSLIALDSFTNSIRPDVVACLLSSRAPVTNTGQASDAYRLTIMPNIHEPQFGDPNSNGWTWISGGNTYLILLEKSTSRTIDEDEFRVSWVQDSESIPLVGEIDGVVFSIPNSTVFYMGFKSFRVQVYEEKVSYNFFDFVADFGGWTGLFVGITITSFLELIGFWLFGTARKESDPKYSKRSTQCYCCSDHGNRKCKSPEDCCTTLRQCCTDI